MAAIGTHDSNGVSKMPQTITDAMATNLRALATVSISHSRGHG